MYRISSSLNKNGSASLAFNVRLSCLIRLDRILESRIVDMASIVYYVFIGLSLPLLQYDRALQGSHDRCWSGQEGILQIRLT